MGMAAQSIESVDHFADAREELEAVFKKLTEAGATHHVTLTEILEEGLSRVGAMTFQGHLDALFEKEKQEVKDWAHPAGSRVRARDRGLENEYGRMTVWRHGLTLPGENEARFPMDEQLSLPKEIYALSLRERVSEAAVDASF